MAPIPDDQTPRGDRDHGGHGGMPGDGGHGGRLYSRSRDQGAFDLRRSDEWLLVTIGAGQEDEVRIQGQHGDSIAVLVGAVLEHQAEWATQRVLRAMGCSGLPPGGLDGLEE